MSPDAGIVASLCVLVAALMVAWRSGREAERLRLRRSGSVVAASESPLLGLYRRE